MIRARPGKLQDKGTFTGLGAWQREKEHIWILGKNSPAMGNTVNRAAYQSRRSCSLTNLRRRVRLAIMGLLIPFNAWIHRFWWKLVFNGSSLFQFIFLYFSATHIYKRANGYMPGQTERFQRRPDSIEFPSARHVKAHSLATISHLILHTRCNTLTVLRERG